MRRHLHRRGLWRNAAGMPEYRQKVPFVTIEWVLENSINIVNDYRQSVFPWLKSGDQKECAIDPCLERPRKAIQRAERILGMQEAAAKYSLIEGETILYLDTDFDAISAYETIKNPTHLYRKAMPSSAPTIMKQWAPSARSLRKRYWCGQGRRPYRIRQHDRYGNVVHSSDDHGPTIKIVRHQGDPIDSRFAKRNRNQGNDNHRAHKAYRTENVRLFLMIHKEMDK